RESEVPIPPAIRMAAEYTLIKELVDALDRASREPLPDRAFAIARELESLDLTALVAEHELLLRRAAESRAEALQTDPLGPDLAQTHRLLDLAAALGITVNLGPAEGRRPDVHSVGCVQVPWGPPPDPRDAVLPKDRLLAAEHDDAVVEVVVQDEVAVRQLQRQRRMIQPAGPGGGPVGPHDLPG